MPVLRLIPAYKDYIWGGQRLVREYHKQYDGVRLAESWELSCHPDGKSVIAEGDGAGMELSEYLKRKNPGGLGTNCSRFKDFPILVKLIDADEDLSVQVHPSDSYALKHEGQYGKTEAWYVMDARPGAVVYCGLTREVTEEELQAHIENQTLMELLHPLDARRGDVVLVEPGTIHAIGGGILVAEIQQNSNLTYRMYDYGRMDGEGRKRPLQLDKALAVADRKPTFRGAGSAPHLAQCRYFTIDKLYLDGYRMRSMKGSVGEDTFQHLMVLEGEGEVICGGSRIYFSKGDSLLFTAGSGAYEISGNCEGLLTFIPQA